MLPGLFPTAWSTGPELTTMADSPLRRAGVEIRRAARAALVAAACLAAARPAGAVRYADGDVAGNKIVLNDNGAWSWFEDERAIVDVAAGKLLVSSVAHSSGGGPAERHADVEVAALDLATGVVSPPFTLSTLDNTGTADDHNSAALLALADGRYLAAYAGHNIDNKTRYRTSTSAGSTSSWANEESFLNSGNVTYNNLHRLSAEGGRIYNFVRAAGLDPYVLTSTNDGDTWSSSGKLLTWPVPTGDPKFTGSDGGRPYLKYASNGVDEIHFIASDDHPRAYDNSIYHGVIRGGKVYDSFGNEVDGNVFDAAAPAPNAYTTVFDTDASPLGFAWTTDLALDSQGRPYAAFTARANNDDPSDHRFLYARFNGTQWIVHEVAKAGGFLYGAEPDYTGLAALDPSDPNRLFISTKIDPRTDVAMPRYEIFEGQTADGGDNWTWSPITFNSTVDNLRPIVPKWDDEHRALLWMRGTYTSFTNFNLEIVGLTEFAPLAGLTGDLNGDNEVNVEDATLYLSGLHADLSGLTAAQARMKGDMNGDFQNDHRDFVIFRQAYELEHGAGSLAAALQVPEPAGVGWLALGGAAILRAATSACRPAPARSCSAAADRAGRPAWGAGPILRSAMERRSIMATDN